MKAFIVRDGFGLTLLREAGVRIAIVTGRQSSIVATRAAELRFDAVEQGVADKVAALRALAARFGLDLSQTAFMGDDWPDLGAMSVAGLAAAPADAAPEVVAAAHWVSSRPGGRGAVRDFAQWLLGARGRARGVARPPPRGERGHRTLMHRACTTVSPRRSRSVLLAVLAAFTYYLAELADQFRDSLRPRPLAHEPDYFVERFAVTRLNQQGEPLYRMSAERLTHFADDDSSEFDAAAAGEPRPASPEGHAQRAPWHGGRRAPARRGSTAMSCCSRARPRATRRCGSKPITS